MIKRSDEMPTHKGQVGFMGGHKNAGEDNPFVTAKREFEEESGISASCLDLYGLGDPVLTSRRRMVIPVIGRVGMSQRDFFDQVQSNGEWENLLLVDYRQLQRAEFWQRGMVNDRRNDSVFFFPLITQHTIFLNGADSEDHCALWGASAKMIVNFFKKYS